MDPGSCITPWDIECMLCDEMAEPKALPLSLLKEITDGFSNEKKIGSGAFAVVYKGMLENRNVAVKRMSNTYMYEKEFQREVECLMIAKHKNIVRFLGYCADTQGTMARHKGKFIMADVQQRLLCFEYLPKGSLHGYITDMSSGLQWRDRYQIITGICQGLHYLHQKNILHLDLKPANILLDGSWVPKITDFGISRCFDQMQSQVITNIAGTPGYLAPESFNRTEITYRNSYRLDIYSLGVVITEILTGEKGYYDVDEVVESWSDMLEDSHCFVQMEQVRLCAEIGIECTNFDPTKRPDTQNIISRLSETESLDGYIETSVSTSPQINPDMLIGTAHTLWLSYQQLNPDIRRCLEYCSIFPRESKLGRNQLVRLWIAQSFVKTGCSTEDMEDVADGYIQELVSYSFLQPEATSSDTDCFTIHDVMYNILDKVAGNCFRIENASRHIGEDWEGEVPRHVQHLFVRYYDAELITEKILGLKNLLTLIVYIVEYGTPLGENIIESICKQLPKLRVLAIAFSKYGEIEQPKEFVIPESICELKQLRYFAFRTTLGLRVFLPRAVNKLRHVQLLDFGGGNISEFNFGDLINLRNMFCSAEVKFSNISKLISLQRLYYVFEIRNAQGCEVKQLRDLNKLRGALRIKGIENVTSMEEGLEANLAAKEGLTELDLDWNLAGRRCTAEVETKVLEGLCPPVGLKILRITGYRGSRYPDWMVGKQNSALQELSFYRCSQSEPPPGLVEAFPRLRLLRLSSCHWNALPGNIEDFTSLQELYITFCRNIPSLPTLPQALGEFCLDSCNDEFMMSCLIFGNPNWQKIEHIPQKRIMGLSNTARMAAKILSSVNRLRCL